MGYCLSTPENTVVDEKSSLLNQSGPNRHSFPPTFRRAYGHLESVETSEWERENNTAPQGYHASPLASKFGAVSSSPATPETSEEAAEYIEQEKHQAAGGFPLFVTQGKRSRHSANIRGTPLCQHAHQEQEVTCVSVVPGKWRLRPGNAHPQFGLGSEDDDHDSDGCKKDVYTSPEDFPQCHVVLSGGFAGSIKVWQAREEQHRGTREDATAHNTRLTFDPIAQLQMHSPTKDAAIVSLRVRLSKDGSEVGAGIAYTEDEDDYYQCKPNVFLASADSRGHICVWDIGKVFRIWNEGYFQAPILVGHETHESSAHQLKPGILDEEGQVVPKSQLLVSSVQDESNVKGLHLVEGKVFRVFRQRLEELGRTTKEDDWLLSFGDKLIKVWQFPSLQCTYILKGHKSAITHIELFPSSIESCFASNPFYLQLMSLSSFRVGAGKGSVRIWKVPRPMDRKGHLIEKPRKLRAETVIKLPGKVHDARLNLYAKGIGLTGLEHRPQLVAVVESSTSALDITVLDLEQGLVLHQFDQSVPIPVDGMCIVPPLEKDNAFFAVATRQKEDEQKSIVQIRDLATLEVVYQTMFPSRVTNVQYQHGRVICSLAEGHIAVVNPEGFESKGDATDVVSLCTDSLSKENISAIDFFEGHVIAGKGCTLFVW